VLHDDPKNGLPYRTTSYGETSSTKDGLLKADWKESETGREAKFYSLTRSGQKQLRSEKESWVRLAGAVQLIFDEGAAQ